MRYAILAIIILVLVFLGISLIHGAKPRTGIVPVATSTPAQQAQLAALTGKVLFVSRRDGTDHVYVMDANGANVKQLTTGPYRDATAEWSPDGSKIVFERSEDGEAVYLMNADGSGLRRLSQAHGADVLPAFSADGKEVVFTRILTPSVPPPGTKTAIMAMSLDGANVRTIYNDGHFNMEPRYSPDGSTIVFMCGKPNVGVGICAINADGSHERQLVGTRGAVYGDPHWSSDGTQLAFGSNKEGGGKLNIYVMNADGSNVRQLTHLMPPYEAGDTGFSPDGAYIAFEWDIDGKSQSDPAAHAEVWYVKADGSEAPFSSGQVCSGVGCAPRWQPLGR